MCRRDGALFFLGHYGDPPAPVDEQIAERVLANPAVERLRDLEPITLEGARAALRGADLRGGAAAAPDDARGAGRRDGRRARPRTRRRPPQRPGRAPIVTLLAELAKRPAITQFALVKDADTVLWRRGG